VALVKTCDRDAAAFLEVGPVDPDGASLRR
jgi:hypothetical protein